MKTTIARLLPHPHRAVFDKSADEALAFTINRDGGLLWSIAEHQLTVVTADRTYQYDLSLFTVGSLINRLKADRFTVAYHTSILFGRSAMVLIESSGDTNTSNGDRVMGFTSILWALYSAYSIELRRAKLQVVQAIRQMIIWQSEGEWTDVWGSLFGISRDEAEADPHYANRIPREAFRLRVNKYAIEMAIRDLTGRKVFIGETWPDMFRLDESKLSGTSRFVSDEQYRYGYIQPLAKELFDWDGVLEVIHRNKAAGVIVLPPRVEVSYFVDSALAGLIKYGILAHYGAIVRIDDGVRLDVMSLGNASYNRNWRVKIDFTWAITPPDHLSGTTALGILDEWDEEFILYGEPSFQPLTPIREDERTPVGVNFNNWSVPRKWSDGDTWASRGASVPRHAQVAIEHTTE